MAGMFQRVSERKEWKFFSVLPKAAPGLALAWWLALLLRGALPAAFAIAMGVLVGAAQSGDSLAGPLALVGTIFVLLQILSPIHQAVSANLGDRAAAWLYDRVTEACVRPAGIGHLEDPKLTSDLTVARDFDLGMTGPPLTISMDFIASGLVELTGGLASAVVLAAYAWWAPLLLAGAWLATHWLLRESSVWRDRNTEEVRGAQRDADYAYRLAVDPPASKELRLFGLVGWTMERFIARRTRLHELQYAATRLRERPLIWSLLLVVGANIAVFWALASSAANGRITLGAAVVYMQSAVGVSMIAFGGFSWALDGAAAPVAAVLRLEPAMRPAGALQSGSRAVDIKRAHEIRLRDVTFSYLTGGVAPVLARGYDGGTDLSGGQWQRVALARALSAVKMSAGVVLLDEPTAQLDVGGEAEIFERLLAATRHCTTILISHRFSTVRHADRICVLERGRVIELGTHDELMALAGRYRTMFGLQAQRFNVPDDEEDTTYDVLS